MAEPKRIVRGWIYIDGTRNDDGSVTLGTGEEIKLNPFEAMGEKSAAKPPASAVLKASVQRLVFWKR
jgi:hypothetical protein